MTSLFSRAELERRCPRLLRWLERGWLRPLDVAVAAFCCDLEKENPAREAASELALLSAALVSHQEGRGHVCLDLRAALADASATLALPPPEAEPEGAHQRLEILPEGLTLAAWQAELRRQRAWVGEVNAEGEAPDASVLVLAGSRLYLRRYWRYEQDVCRALARRLQGMSAAGVPEAGRLRPLLDRLFPQAAFEVPDWQKLACALAARCNFCVITGGPGRGKTTTVVKLLALRLALSPDLRVRIAAPTGKAAVRLQDAIATAKRDLPEGFFGGSERIPDAAVTVHRLLGSRPETRRYQHHAGNPLPLDLLVVDEASMLSLDLMQALLAALPPQAGLILLGDKDQLASVEAGSVLGALCARAEAGHYLPATRDWLAAATGERIPETMLDVDGRPLDQAVAMLRYNHRSKEAPEIGVLAEAINVGAVQPALASLRAGQGGVTAIPLPANDTAALDAALRRLLLCDQTTARGEPTSYLAYLERLRRAEGIDVGMPSPERDRWAGEVLAAFAAFRLLCAVRRGTWGVEGINARVARLLREAGMIARETGAYVGRPVLVTRNDYALGLMNGDVGVQMTASEVAFPASVGPEAPHGVLWRRVGRLSDVETAYALTTHKAQGSEFVHSALILPDRASPTLTRELLYTALTRSRQRFTLLYADADVLAQSIRARVSRASGLAEALLDE